MKFTRGSVLGAGNGFEPATEASSTTVGSTVSLGDPLQQQSLFRHQISEMSPDEIRMSQRRTQNLRPLLLRGDT